MNTRFTLHFAIDDMSNESDVHVVLGRCLDAYTLTRCVGAWNGELEPAYVLTVYGESCLQDTVERVADDIKREFLQQAVLMVVEPVTTKIL